MSSTLRRRRLLGLVVAVAFGAAGATIAAIGTGGLSWVLTAGFGTFALVELSYLGTERLTRPQPPAPAPVPAPPPRPPASPVTQPLPPPPPPPPPPPEVDKDIAIVFVHGIVSDAQAWEPFERLIRNDPDLAEFGVEQFEYDTRLLQPQPDRRNPELDTIARQLTTRFERLERRDKKIVIVSHSMGGLVAQGFVARMLAASAGERLPRIKRIVMFACPTQGSEYLRTLRALAPIKHNQEEVLGVLNREVTNLQQAILTNVVHAKEITDTTCPISIRLYAGASDNIVLPQSALGVYPDKCTGVIGGDHKSIICPDSPQHDSYLALKDELEIVLDELRG